MAQVHQLQQALFLKVAGFVLITKSGPLELLQTTKSEGATDPNLLPPEVPGSLTDRQQQYDDVVKEMLQVCYRFP